MAPVSAGANAYFADAAVREGEDPGPVAPAYDELAALRSELQATCAKLTAVEAERDAAVRRAHLCDFRLRQSAHDVTTLTAAIAVLARDS